MTYNPSLTVENLTQHEVRVYLYHRNDPLCRVPFSTISVPAGQFKLCTRTSKKFRISRGGEKLTEPIVFDCKCDVWRVVQSCGNDSEIVKETERTGTLNLPYRGALAYSLISEELFRLYRGSQAHSLLVKNNSHNDIKIYLYGRFNFTKYKVCSESMIVKPRETRLKKTSMKFDVFRTDQGSEIRLSEPTNLQYDTMCEVNQDAVSFTRIDDNTNSKKELQLQEEKMNFQTNVTSNGIENFYEALGLNMEEERKKPYDDQSRAIKQAYLKLSLKMHPDRNQNNVNYNREIWNMMLRAYEELADEKKRVEYHNKYDFQQPYYSKAFWRSLFWSEIYDENNDGMLRERIKLCIKRIAFFAASRKILHTFSTIAHFKSIHGWGINLSLSK